MVDFAFFETNMKFWTIFSWNIVQYLVRYFWQLQEFIRRPTVNLPSSSCNWRLLKWFPLIVIRNFMFVSKKAKSTIVSILILILSPYSRGTSVFEIFTLSFCKSHLLFHFSLEPLFAILFLVTAFKSPKNPLHHVNFDH